MERLLQPASSKSSKSRKCSKLKGVQREADVAQLVEQSIRNRQVIGSSPIVGSMFNNGPTWHRAHRAFANLNHGRQRAPTVTFVTFRSGGSPDRLDMYH